MNEGKLEEEYFLPFKPVLLLNPSVISRAFLLQAFFLSKMQSLRDLTLHTQIRIL